MIITKKNANYCRSVSSTYIKYDNRLGGYLCGQHALLQFGILVFLRTDYGRVLEVVIVGGIL